MMQKDKPTDYVLATGKTYTVKDFIEKAFQFKGIQITWKYSGLREEGIDQNGITRIKISAKYYRPCEVDLLLGYSTKAQKELGWVFKYDTLEKLIENMFE